MSGFGNPIIGALGQLIRSAIRSVNYVAGLTGWQISRDGDAEFSNLTARGSLEAKDPDGSYVKITTDPTLGALVEMRPPDTAGTTIVPGRVSSGLNPDSGETGITIVGPNVDAGGTAQIVLSSSGFWGGELSMTSGYFWLTSTGGTSWVVNGDWEIAHEVAPNSFLIHFQVQQDGSVYCDRIQTSPAVGSSDTFGGDVFISGDLNVSGIGESRYILFSTLSKTNSTTLSDIPTDKTISLKANSKYIAEVYVSYDGPTAANAKFAWAASSATVVAARNITALAVGSASNVNGSVQLIRRGLTTAQAVATTAGVANAFQVYQEWTEFTNPDAVARTVTLQFAQNTLNATPSVVQSGYLRITRVA